MAITLGGKVQNGTSVGAFVYRAYTPAKCGVVIEDLGPIGNGYFHRLKVKMINGKVEEIESGLLNDYEELIADHKKKYDGHMAKLEKLKQFKQDSA